MFVILCFTTLPGVAVTRLRAERSGFERGQGQEGFLFSRTSRRVPGPTQPRIHWVEVKVKVKFTLEQATKAQRGSRSIAVLFI